MAREDYETYVVVIGRRNGERYAERHQLQVPLAVVRGHYEKLSTLQLREMLNDLIAETQRREDPEPTYDPLQSQYRGERT